MVDGIGGDARGFVGLGVFEDDDRALGADIAVVVAN